MMFLYKRQPLHSQKIKNTKVSFKSTGKPNTWRKHTPPRIKISSEERT